MTVESENIREKMNIILEERKTGKSRELCAKDTGIPITDIIKWYYGGRNGNGEDNIYFFEKLSEIEEALKKSDDASADVDAGKSDVASADDNVSKSDDLVGKINSDLEEYNAEGNDDKRSAYLNCIREGKSRREACEISGLEFDKVTHWESLGNKNIEPYSEFHNLYAQARLQAEKNDKLDNFNVKNAVVNLIRKSLTLREAARHIHNGKYEKNILKWYDAGKNGDETHADFYNRCVKASKNPVNTYIMAPLPGFWKNYFKNKQNKSGFAWVYLSQNKWFYSRKMDGKTVKFYDYDLKKLHKRVVGANQLWGVTDVNKAKKSLSRKNKRVTVNINRINKNKFKAEINGIIQNRQILNVLNKFRFFENDVVGREIKQLDSKFTLIKIEIQSDISLLNSFEKCAKSFKWRIYL